MTIKQFSIEYDSINSKNTFTNGDTVNGRIIVEASKQTKIKSLIFIAQGKARVSWHEQHGEDHRVYWSDEKYYDVKQHIVRESRHDGTDVIGKGRHIFPFSFRIPDRKIPSSFRSSIGKIVHKVKAELKQSLQLTKKKAKAHFTFVSQADMDVPRLLQPQHDCKNKAITFFGSGTVSMDVHTGKMGYMQGEALQVTVEICNHSTRSVKPKIILYEKKSFFAQGHRIVHTNEIHKEKITTVASFSNETLTGVISIPTYLPPSILNCSIIKFEYWLKIHLDIKYASDLEIKLPIIVLPKDSAMKQLPAHAVFGLEACGNPNQLTLSTTPAQAAPQPTYPPPSYSTYAMYPPLTDTGNYKTAL